MKKLALLIVMFIPLPSVAANIKMGNYEVGGSARFASGNNSSYFELAPDVQYFFIDNFSAGGEAALAFGSGGYHAYSLGPTATFYVLAKEDFAPYISISPIAWTKYNYTSAFYDSSVKLGLKYFLTEAVAVGPALKFNHTYGRNGRSGFDTTSLLVTFAIHL